MDGVLVTIAEADECIFDPPAPRCRLSGVPALDDEDDDLLNKASAEKGLTLISFLGWWWPWCWLLLLLWWPWCWLLLLLWLGLVFMVRSIIGVAFKADSFLRLSPPITGAGCDGVEVDFL